MATILPIILAAGAAVLFLGKKKKSTRKTSIPSRSGPIRIGLFKASGAHPKAVSTASDFLSKLDEVAFRTFTPNDVMNGVLDQLDVVFFTGGSGSRQGESLGEAGREKVRRFVHDGGGYIGICAGSYLAMQGKDEFHKLRILDGANKTGDSWKRGIKDVLVQADTRGGPIAFRMHYENGPLFSPAGVEELQDYIPLGIYLEETWSTPNNTHEGEMVGTPVITASRFGEGRVLLFGPNPMLGKGDAVQLQMFVDAINWVSHPASVPPDLRFDEVFISKR